MPLQHRHGYAAGLHRGLPAGEANRPRSSPPGDAVADGAEVSFERATDGRSQNIVLTEAGRQLTQAAGAAAAPMERELDDRLSRAERLMLIELLRKVAGR